MPQQTIRRINLYDFFSVLLPGLTFLFGIYPILPIGFTLNSLGAALSLLVIGFVIGRVVHTIATSLHQWLSASRFFNINTHREDFASVIQHSNYLPEKVIDEFHSKCRRTFLGIGLHYYRDYDNSEEDTEVLDTLYMCVRSYTHIGSQGPSENFQAIYAFHRSTWLVMAALFVVYLTAGLDILLREFGLPLTGFEYSAKISALNIPLALTVVIAILFSGIGIYVFLIGMLRYKKIYVRYIVTDFLALRISEKSNLK